MSGASLSLRRVWLALLVDWSPPRADDRRDRVNRGETATELEAFRAAAERDQPFRSDAWLACSSAA